MNDDQIMTYYEFQRTKMTIRMTISRIALMLLIWVLMMAIIPGSLITIVAMPALIALMMLSLSGMIVIYRRQKKEIVEK